MTVSSFLEVFENRLFMLPRRPRGPFHRLHLSGISYIGIGLWDPLVRSATIFSGPLF